MLLTWGSHHKDPGGGRADNSERHADDFEQFGLDLVGVTPKIISELGYHYGVDAEPFFTGFFLGDWVDGIWGENTMTTFAFQAIRQKAWLNGLLLQDWRWGVAEGDIRGFWKMPLQIRDIMA